MGKNLRRNGMVTFYVRKDYIPIYEEFVALVNKDEKMKQLQYQKNASLVSIFFTNAAINYVKKRKAELGSGQAEEVEEEEEEEDIDEMAGEDDNLGETQ